MKASNLRKGLRIKVKQCCGIEMHRGKYGTVWSDSLKTCKTVLVKIDGREIFDELQPTSIKLSDEKPEVGDRIVVLSKQTDYFDIGATGIVRRVGASDLMVKFDDGVYRRSGNVDSWYVGNDRKIGIIEGDAK